MDVKEFCEKFNYSLGLIHQYADQLFALIDQGISRDNIKNAKDLKISLKAHLIMFESKFWRQSAKLSLYSLYLLGVEDEEPMSYEKFTEEKVEFEKNKRVKLKMSIDVNGDDIKHPLPDGLLVDGDVSILRAKRLPKSLLVRGNATFRGAKIKEIPEGLGAVGSLDLSESDIEKIPDNFFANGDVILLGSKLKEIGRNINIQGTLDIRGTEVREFPELEMHQENYIAGDLIIDPEKEYDIRMTVSTGFNKLVGEVLFEPRK